jgi:hypothetical protein
MSIAPIITAVELTFNPMDYAMTQAKIHKLEPLNILILQNPLFSSSPLT